MPRTNIYREVVAKTISASSEDSRFPKVRPEELDDIDITVEILTVPKEVPSYTDIEIGRHGIWIRKGARGATYLPNVAPEQGWDLETTLNHLARKAGIPPDGWRSGTTFLVYEAQIFDETPE
jgi:AmmeMemoRadiSam system protein A